MSDYNQLMAAATGCLELGALGPAAMGVIGPATPADERLAQDLIAAVKAGTLLRRVSPNTGDRFTVNDCMDGRIMTGAMNAPRSAGASLALCLLAVGAGMAPDLGALTGTLRAAGYPLWAHDGCGFNENLGPIATTLRDYGEWIDGLRDDLGLAPTGPWRATLAEWLIAYAATSTPAERAAPFARLGGYLPEPDGGHTAMIDVINRVSGTTVDKLAVKARFGVQTFCIDAWALADSVLTLAETARADVPGDWLFLADVLLDLNFATALTLANPQMRLIANAPA